MFAATAGSLGVTSVGSANGRGPISESRFQSAVRIFLDAAEKRKAITNNQPDSERGYARTIERPLDPNTDSVTLDSIAVDDTGILAIFKRKADAKGPDITTIPLDAGQAEDAAYEADLLTQTIPRWDVPQLHAGHAMAILVNKRSNPQLVRDTLMDFHQGRPVSEQTLRTIAGVAPPEAL